MLYLAASDNLFSSLQSKNKMQNQLYLPITVHRGGKNEAEIVSEVHSKNTVKPNILPKLALVRPCGSKMINLAVNLAIEKRSSAELLDIVDVQHDQMNELVKIVQKAEKHRADMETRIHELGEIMIKKR